MCAETNDDFGHIDENQSWIGSELEEVLDSDDHKKNPALKNLMCCIIVNFLTTIT